MFYNNNIKKGSSITQKAFYNISTGEIECITVVGKTLGSHPFYLYEIEINMTLYVHDIVDTEYNEKVNALLDYVKSNAD